ncbi:hypothetical protein [Aeromonas allosaccharophila]|uniref:Uncharacterized protein n=1 Tax=Aeromonas allosaccharophila TaxID=656 RepID=A0AAX3NW18_9GAMM|nr:hypothetical protein [Aeromonas allosaccharophila]WED78333.1 hypothetical protein PYU98_08995 [Aeromonas allosaccharophila]
MMESNNPLVHLALLESLKDNKISDEIDLFLPFIAVILSEIAGDEITPHLLQDKFAQSFGVEPPISAIKVFITRAKKESYFIGKIMLISKVVNKSKSGKMVFMRKKMISKHHYPYLETILNTLQMSILVK